MTHPARFCLMLILFSAAMARGQEPQPPAVPTVPLEDPTFPPVELQPIPPAPPPRFRFEADVGAGGLGRLGALRPAERFASRWWLFPTPTVRETTVATGRVGVGYQFAQSPLSVGVAWEGYTADERVTLLGHDPRVAGLLNGLNSYNEERREQEQDGHWPTLQMRDSASESMILRTRATANVAEAAVAWKVWTPREERGVEYRLIAGARYGGFFTDDRADGYGYFQQASNWFGGGGPEGGLRIDFTPALLREMPGNNRFHLDARSGVLFGEATQRFRETDPILGGATPYREFVQRGSREVPFLATEFGATTGSQYARWGVGVRYAKYWGVGNVGPSRRDFEVVALFLRLEVGF